MARQENYMSKQDLLISQLTIQQRRFKLVEAAYNQEMQMHKEMYELLNNINQQFNQKGI